MSKKKILFKNYSLVIPVYNEGTNIYALVSGIRKLKKYDNLKIIVINDGSEDNTFNECKRVRQKYKNIQIVSNLVNKGQSFAILKGIKTAKTKFIIAIDGDMQHKVSDIDKAVHKFEEGYDIVVGRRTNKKYNYCKKILSYVGNTVICVLFDIKIRDLFSSFKVFKREIFADISYNNCWPGWHRYLVVIAKICDYSKFENFTINDQVRKTGKSKYGIVYKSLGFIRDIYNLKRYKQSVKNTSN